DHLAVDNSVIRGDERAWIDNGQGIVTAERRDFTRSAGRGDLKADTRGVNPPNVHHRGRVRQEIVEGPISDMDKTTPAVSESTNLSLLRRCTTWPSRHDSMPVTSIAAFSTASRACSTVTQKNSFLYR